MEVFESDDPVERDSSTSIRSDRYLIGSSSSSVLGKTGGGRLGGGTNEDVDTVTNIKPELAFQRFAGALYGESGRALSRGATGVFESHPPSAAPASATEESRSVALKFESPFARLQRLQEELREFDTELREATRAQSHAGTGAEASAADSVWSELSSNVQQLQQQLSTILSQPQVKQLLESDGSGAQAAHDAAGTATAARSTLLPRFDSLFQHYVEQLKADPSFQPHNDQTPRTSATTSATESHTSTSSAELAALPKLDERLHALEKLMGLSGRTATNKPPTVSMLSFNAPSSTSSSTASSSLSNVPSVSTLPAPDLVTALQSLHTQLSALSPARVEWLARSFKQLLIDQETMQVNKEKEAAQAHKTATNAATEKKGEDGKEATAAAEASRPYASQVSHLYALTSRWDSLALSLPTLISRLSSLHSLHAASARLVSSVSSLERLSGEIDSALSRRQDAMESLRKTAIDNSETLRQNLAAMDKRIQELSTRMEQLKSK